MREQIYNLLFDSRKSGWKARHILQHEGEEALDFPPSNSDKILITLRKKRRKLRITLDGPEERLCIVGHIFEVVGILG